MKKYIVYLDSQLLNKPQDAFILIDPLNNTYMRHKDTQFFEFNSSINYNHLLEIWKDEIKLMEFYE